MRVLDVIRSHTSRAEDTWALLPILPHDPSFTLYLHDGQPDIDHVEFRHSDITLHNDDPNIQHAINSHGTQMLSVAVGKTTGASPKTPVQFFCFEPASALDMIESFESLCDHALSAPGRSAVCLNWQLDTKVVAPDIINRANRVFKRLEKKKIPVFVACGNTGSTELIYPCDVPSVTVTGSFDPWGLISLFNNAADKIEIFAPGRKVTVAKEKTLIDYAETSGSSVANTIVAASMAYFSTVDAMLEHSIKGVLNDKGKGMDTDNRRPTTRALYVGETVQNDADIACEYGNTKIELVNNNQRIIHTFTDTTDTTDMQYDDVCVAYLNRTLNGNIIVPMSGGLDSEFVMHCVIKSKLTPTAAIMRYVDDRGRYLNEFDFKYAEDYCAKHNIPIQYIDAPIEKLFDQGEYWPFAKNYVTRSPQLAAHLWLLDKFRLATVMPGDPMTVTNGSYGIQPFDYYCYDRYLAGRNSNSVARLHTASGDIVRKGNDITRSLTAITKQDRKFEFYRKAGMTDLVERPKFTGFEQVRAFYDDKYQTVNYFNKKFRFTLQAIFDYGDEFFYHGDLE